MFCPQTTFPKQSSGQSFQNSQGATECPGTESSSTAAFTSAPSTAREIAGENAKCSVGPGSSQGQSTLLALLSRMALPPFSSVTSTLVGLYGFGFECPGPVPHLKLGFVSWMSWPLAKVNYVPIRMPGEHQKRMCSGTSSPLFETHKPCPKNLGPSKTPELASPCFGCANSKARRSPRLHQTKFSPAARSDSAQIHGGTAGQDCAAENVPQQLSRRSKGAY